MSRVTRFARSWSLRRAPTLFAAFARPTTAELGECGEQLAARHLRRRGFRLLGRRVATPHGEIDVIAEYGDRLVCVEVKAARVPSSTALRWRPGWHLDRRRLERQRRAGRWLARNLAPERLAGGRVDLVEVLFQTGPAPVEIIHHADLRRPLGRDS